MRAPAPVAIRHPPDDALGAAYPVALPAFTGPLHLLLSLLEQRQLDISAVSLAAITAPYLETMADARSLRAHSLCAFLDTASHLLVLKARFLLPDAPADAADEETETLSLLAQLAALQAYDDGVAWLAAREKQGLRTYRRHAPLPAAGPQAASHWEDPSRLGRALLRVARSLPRTQPPTAPPRPRFPLAAQMRRIVRVLRQWRQARAATSVSFFVLLRSESPRGEIVATFLAMLEMVRVRAIKATQAQPFGDITLHWLRD